jgi:hypothetical protein
MFGTTRVSVTESFFHLLKSGEQSFFSYCFAQPGCGKSELFESRLCICTRFLDRCHCRAECSCSLIRAETDTSQSRNCSAQFLEFDSEFGCCRENLSE